MDNAIIVVLEDYNKIIDRFLETKGLNVISNNGLQIIFKYRKRPSISGQARHIKNITGKRRLDSKLPKDVKHGIIRIVMLSESIAYIDHTTSKLKDIKEHLNKNNINYLNAQSCLKETDQDIRKRIWINLIRGTMPGIIDDIKYDVSTDPVNKYETINLINKINLIPTFDRSFNWYPDYIDMVDNQYMYELANFNGINKLAERVITSAYIIADDKDHLFRIKYDMNIDRTPLIIVNVSNSHHDLQLEMMLLLITNYFNRLCLKLKIII
jgi:hypothetical protein